MASLSRVAEEFEVPDSGFADYALLDKSGEAIIIIESKSIDVKIDKALPPDQLKRYVHKLANCNVCAWTSGLEWQWFCLDYTNTLSSVPFMKFNVSEKDWLSPLVLRWLASVRGQFDNPDPTELLRVARGYEFTEKLRAWIGAGTQLSNRLVDTLWRELGIKKSTPSSADRDVLRTAWTMLHERPSDKPHPPTGSEDPPLAIEPNSGPKPDPTRWDTHELKIEDDHKLVSSKQKRAWRVWDLHANRWDNWNVENSAAKVQAAVAEWLISWNGGMKNLPDKINGIDKRPTGKYSSDWSSILDGSWHIKTHMDNPRKKKWLDVLASKVVDENGRSPQLGKDFEVWLPPWINVSVRSS